MGKRLEGLRSLRSKGPILPAIIGGGALALFIVAALVRWHAPAQPATSARRLSTKTKDRLEAKARELAPATSFYFSYVSLQAGALAKLDAKDLDEGTILEFCQRVVDGSDAFVREFSGEIQQAAVIEGVQPADIQKYLSEKLRELDRVAPALRIFQGVSPVKLSILAAPRPPQQSGNGLGPEAAKVQAIQHLLEVLAKLPPQSNGANGIKNAIVAMRKAIIAFDTTPIAITFTAPATNTVTKLIPAIAFTLSDSGSGPNPDSRQLLAINRGPVAPGTTDLTGFAQVTLNDQINGVVKVEATNTPAATIQDGFITLQASATDFANNPRTVATDPFVLDRVPPVVDLTSPTDGASFTSTSIPLNVIITDGVSGVKVSSIRVTLNGADITDGITEAPGPANSLGAPNFVLLTGSMTGQLGPNVMAIFVADLAGNEAKAQLLFSVQLPLSRIVLQVSSGDGQEGLAGRGANDDLVVLATDGITGLPVRGLLLVFDGMANAGTFAKSSTLSTITNGNGIGGLRYVFSRVAGENVVSVQAAGYEDVSPIEFHLSGKLPTVEDATTFGLCNNMPLTSEYPGSAIRRLITVRVKKPDGSALKNELVRPFVSNSPTLPVGKFLPSKVLTDSNGEAKFAFVIDRKAQPGNFTMRMGLPNFRDNDGNEVSLTVGGEVLDPLKRPPGPVVAIDLSAKDQFGEDLSGQAQIGLPKRELALQLRATASQAAAGFQIIEGSGTLLPGDQGGDVFVDPCGKTFLIVFPDSTGRASARFTPGSSLALIALTPASDVFAVGPPEVTFVSKNTAGELVEIPNVAPIQTTQAEDQYAYQVFVKAPKGVKPTGELRAHNSFGEVLENIVNGVAPSFLSSADIKFTFLSGESKPTFDAYTCQKIIQTDQLVPAGTTPTGSTGEFTFLETTTFGGATACVTVGEQEQKQEKITKIDNTILLKRTQRDKRGLIFNKQSPPVPKGGEKAEPTVVEVSFNIDGAKELTRIDWDLLGHEQTDPTKFDKTFPKEKDKPVISRIFVKLADATDIDNHKGIEGDPVILGVPENKDNRRKDILLRAKVEYTDKDDKPITVTLRKVLRIALNSPVPEGTTAAATIDDQDKLNAFVDPVGKGGWKTKPPPDSAGKPIQFDDPNKEKPKPPALAEPFELGLDLAKNPLSFSVKPIPLALAKTYADPSSFHVWGAGISKRAFQWDTEVLTSIIAHEAKHVVSHAEARPADSKTLFRQLGDQLTKDNGILDWQTILDYEAEFDHARIRLDDLLDKGQSYRNLNDILSTSTLKGGPGYEATFVQSFNAVLTSFVLGEDYTERIEGSTNVVVKANKFADPLRGLVLEHLQKIHQKAVTSFPELERKDEFVESLHLLTPPQK